MHSKLLGIKRKYENATIEDDSSSSGSDTEVKYKDIFKFNYLNKDSSKLTTTQKEKVQSNEDIVNNKEKKKQKLSSLTNDTNLLSILPPPKRKLTDKTPQLFKPDQSQSSSTLQALINPDNNNHQVDIKQKDNSPHINQSNKSNVIELNQHDLLDKDWERKYVDKLINPTKQIPTITNDSKMTQNHNIKNVIAEYNQSKLQAEADAPIKSKYGKISTKAKYGW